MSENVLTLYPEQMKELARYEISFEQYISQCEGSEITVEFPEPYTVTLDDISEAIKNLLKENPTISEFGEKYFFPIDSCDAFIIPDADYDREFAELPVNENNVIASIWEDIEFLWSDFEEDEESTSIKDIDFFDDIVERIDFFFDNKGKSVEEIEFPEKEKRFFARRFTEKSRIESATDREIALARKFIDELCGNDEEEFLHLKGYSCYGGNRLYECDWKASRDIMIKLWELTGDATYQNTLGYIYYYGRCTGGVPEYSKAFTCFTTANANGFYEATYKLADMYHHGYGCTKSDSTAHALYSMVYNQLYEQFIKYRNDIFADAALRMGNVYAKGIKVKKSPCDAYLFYLQAKYANDMRMKDSDFFGNTTVAMGISKAIDEVKKDIPYDFFLEYEETEYPYYFDKIVSDGYRAKLSIEALDDGRYRLSAERLPRRPVPEAEPILITEAQLSYCSLVTRIDYICDQINAECFGETAGIKFDYLERNISNNSIEFWYDDNIVCRIFCREFRFYAPSSASDKGKLLNFASVRFNPDGRTYDYLCDVENVNAGDKVIVLGYNGETEVEVTATFEKYEGELGIPLERYKKIVRKS